MRVVLSARTVAQDGTPRSDTIHITAYFLKSASQGLVEVHITPVRTGRQHANISAALVQRVGSFLHFFRPSLTPSTQQENH